MSAVNPAAIEGLTRDDIGRVCVVTGAAGYLGTALCRALVALGAEVRGVDVRPGSAEGVAWHVADVRDPVALALVMAGADTVFHAAAAMSLVGMGPAAARARVFSVNVDGTRAVLDAASQAGVGALVSTSSANVVLDRELVEVGEEVPYAATFVDWYGESKAEGERLVRAADRPGGLRTVALRPGGIWGPGDGGLMLATFLDQLAAGRFVATVGRPDAVVDNTHVDSLVRAELLAARALRRTPDVVGGKAYFVTDDERIQGTAWFRPLVEALGHPWPRARIPGRVAYALAWLGEVAHRLGGPEPLLTRIGVLKLDRSSALRVDAARRDLGYAPLWTRDTGLQACMDDLRARYEARRKA